MLIEDMQAIIATYSAGAVATVNADGTPSVSTKATFIIVDDRTIACGNLRSPGTIANLSQRPAIEECFLDILKRKAVRVSGRATYVAKGAADAALRAAFERDWGDYVEAMTGFVRIEVTATEMILSPAYDRGATEAELHEANLARLNALR